MSAEGKGRRGFVQGECPSTRKIVLVEDWNDDRQTFFCKGSDGKFLKLFGPHRLRHNWGQRS